MKTSKRTLVCVNAVILCLLLSACAPTGGSGGKVFITPEARAKFATATRACVNYLTTNAPISALGSQGFSPFFGDYIASVANPNTIGNTSLRVDTSRNHCSIGVEPALSDESEALMAEAERALLSAGYRTRLSRSAASLAARSLSGGPRGSSHPSDAAVASWNSACTGLSDPDRCLREETA